MSSENVDDAILSFIYYFLLERHPDIARKLQKKINKPIIEHHNLHSTLAAELTMNDIIQIKGERSASNKQSLFDQSINKSKEIEPLAKNCPSVAVIKTDTISTMPAIITFQDVPKVKKTRRSLASMRKPRSSELSVKKSETAKIGKSDEHEDVSERDFKKKPKKRKVVVMQNEIENHSNETCHLKISKNSNQDSIEPKNEKKQKRKIEQSKIKDIITSSKSTGFDVINDSANITNVVTEEFEKTLNVNKSQQSRFQRVKCEEVAFLDDRLRDNSYLSKNHEHGAESSYGYKAHQDLIVTRGKKFTKEKNKKKKSVWKIGAEFQKSTQYTDETLKQ